MRGLFWVGLGAGWLESLFSISFENIKSWTERETLGQKRGCQSFSDVTEPERESLDESVGARVFGATESRALELERETFQQECGLIGP